MTHLGRLLFLVFCFAIASITFAQNINISVPDAPNGMSWYESSSRIGTFLRPNGWFIKEETKGNTKALFITKESIDAENVFKTGLSVNRVINFSPDKSILASTFAKRVIEKLALKGTVLKKTVITGNFPEMNTLRIKLEYPDYNIVTHYITIGDDKSNTFYLILFESPESEWEQQFIYGGEMLNQFFLNFEP